MPADFECERCHLKFTTGWFHHEGCIDGAPYYATTELVCARCGTQHWVDHAETRVPIRLGKAKVTVSVAELDHDQLPDRLMCLPGPIFAESEGNHDAQIDNQEMRVLLESTSIRPLRTLPAVYPGISDEIATSQLSCGNCGSVGSLTTDWHSVPDSSCPHCGTAITDAKSYWMT